MYSLLQNKIKKLSLFYVNKTSPKVWEITIKLTIIQFIQYCRSSEELLKKYLNSGKINIKKKKYQLLYFSKLYNLHICVHWPSTKSQPFPKHEQSNLPIGLFAGTNAFRFFPGRFVVVPEDDAILELDVEGNRVRGFLDAATLALDATLEMTVLRVERSRTEGRNLPVI